MSKYDQIDYLTFSEKEKDSLPDCIKNLNNQEIIVPDELFGNPIENLNKCLNIKNEEDQKEFLFANKNQTIINENYFKNGNYFRDDMQPDEKREFLLDYLNYHFGNKVNGKYFENYLQDIFNLRKYNIIDEDFEVMIEDYFKKKEIDLNDPEDRKKFKKIIFHQEIKFLNQEEAKKYLFGSKRNISDEESNNENNYSKREDKKSIDEYDSEK